MRAAIRGGSSSRRHEREPSIALEIQVASSREPDLIRCDGSQPIDEGELLGEAPYSLRAAERSSPPFGGLALEGVVGLGARDGAAKLLVGHALIPDASDLPQGLALGAGEPPGLELRRPQ